MAETKTVLADSGSFTATLTGCTTSPTVTATWFKVGDMVTINIPGMSATSNTTACTITGMPSSIQSLTNKYSGIVADILDNGTSYAGVIGTGTNTGVLTLVLKATATAALSATFTASGTKGTGNPISIHYLIP